MWLWEASVKTQCVLKCKSVDHKHVWMQRERAGKKGWWKVCTQTRQWLCHSSMTVWWLVTLLAWWWLQCVVEWMWNARECGDAHKRLIAPRWFERKERSTVFGEPHPPIQTHTHSSTCLVCATIATTCVCPLFGCVFVVCHKRLGSIKTPSTCDDHCLIQTNQPQSSPCARLCALFMQQQCLVTCATWLFAQCHCRCRCVAVHSCFQTKHNTHCMRCVQSTQMNGSQMELMHPCGTEWLPLHE